MPEVSAWQHYQCNHHVMSDLSKIDSAPVFEIRHEDFIQDPLDTVRQIFMWAGLGPDPVAEDFAGTLPKINATSGVPASPDGLYYPSEVRAAIVDLPQLKDLAGRMGYAL